MLAGCLVTERVGNFFEGKRAVDYRLDAVCVDCANHVDLLSAAADDKPLQRLLAPHQFSRRHLPGDAGQHTDQGDMTTDAAGTNRLAKRVRTAHFDDVIDTATVGDFEHFRGPVGIALVVDQVIGTGLSNIRIPRPLSSMLISVLLGNPFITIGTGSAVDDVHIGVRMQVAYQLG